VSLSGDLLQGLASAFLLWLAFKLNTGKDCALWVGSQASLLIGMWLVGVPHWKPLIGQLMIFLGVSLLLWLLLSSKIIGDYDPNHKGSPRLDR
jgi:hypothetical protein